MELLYNEEGKAFVPASDFYKEFIFDQLAIAVRQGERKYLETQCAILERIAMFSENFDAMEKKVREEIIDVLGVNYETMKEWFEKNERVTTFKTNKPKPAPPTSKPKLALVK